jgi:hypothetical protein
MVVEQSVFKVGLYPVVVTGGTLNFVGYQDPTVPGSIKTGSLANSDLDDKFPGSKIIEMGAKNDDDFYIQFDIPPSNISTISIEIENPVECESNITADLVFDGTINYTANIPQIYNYLFPQAKNVLPIRLEMS